MITIDTIKAAQAGDFEALSSLVKDMEPRAAGIANRAASRTVTGDYADAADEYRQAANVALWEALGNFKGGSVDGFRAYAYRMMDIAVRHARGDLRGHGVPAHDMEAFGAAVKKAEGDIDLATRYAQIHPYKTRDRMSSARAWAARLAWMGRDSMDVPAVAAQAGVQAAQVDDAPEVDTDRVGVNRVKAAYDFLADYMVGSPALMEACEPLLVGVVTEHALDSISEAVRLPRDRKERHRVQGAFGILAAAIRSADHTATPADEYDDQTEENPERRASIARAQTVRAILDTMAEAQAETLKHLHGIGHPATDLDGVCEATGLTKTQVYRARINAEKSFVKRWVKAMARGKAHADDLAEAFANKPTGGYAV